MNGQIGQLVPYHAEVEVVVKVGLAIIQHQLTEEPFARVRQITNRKNVILMNVQVIFQYLRIRYTHAQNFVISLTFECQFNISSLGSTYSK